MKRYIFFMLFCVMHVHAMDIIIMPLARVMGVMKSFRPKTVIQECYFDKLPLELHNKIMRTLFNAVIDQDALAKKDIDWEKFEKYHLTMPLLLATHLSHDLCEMQKVCKSEIGGKKFSSLDLFFLPKKEERDVFVRMANHSRLVFGNIRAADAEIIEKMKNENIKKGLQLKVNHLNKTVETIRNVGGIGIFMGLFTISGMNDHTAHLLVRIAPMVTIWGGFSLMGLSEVLNLFNSKYSRRDPNWSVEEINL